MVLRFNWIILDRVGSAFESWIVLWVSWRTLVSVKDQLEDTI